MPPAPYCLEMRLPSGEVARVYRRIGHPGSSRRLPGRSGGSKIAPRKLPGGSGGSQIAPQRVPRLPNRCPETSGSSPGGQESQETSEAQNHPKRCIFIFLGGPGPGGPGRSQIASQRVPRSSQIAPRRPPEAQGAQKPPGDLGSPESSKTLHFHFWREGPG